MSRLHYSSTLPPFQRREGNGTYNGFTTDLQNSERLRWTSEEVDNYLHRIMDDIHENCVKYGTEANGYINYVKGANVAGFMKVAKAMMAQGIV